MSRGVRRPKLGYGVQIACSGMHWPGYPEETDALRARIAPWGSREWLLVGDDDEGGERIGRYPDAGADRITRPVDSPGGNADTLRRFAARVL